MQREIDYDKELTAWRVEGRAIIPYENTEKLLKTIIINNKMVEHTKKHTLHLEDKAT